jgi:YgiT-type zinc finger domain-containing protein
MKPLDKCPICAGELEERIVEKLLRGGVHTAAVRVRAEVCLRCGERLYSTQDVERFEDIRTKLQQQQTEGFRLVGQSFEVA